MATLPYDFSTKAGTISAISSECHKQGLSLDSQIAYVLATVEHETAGTFRPVKEAFWVKDPDAYLKKHHSDYYPYYGRGFAQLTWKINYEKYSKLLSQDLVSNPDLALTPDIANFILVHGLLTGTFTGRKLPDYVNNETTDFFNARRCVNGLDKAQEIASLAKKYLAALGKP